MSTLSSDQAQTGPMQFGDDWPGVFLRGDTAGPCGMYLAEFLRWYDALPESEEKTANYWNRLMVGQLLELLSSPIVTPEKLTPDNLQRLRAFAACAAPDEKKTP